MTALFSPRRKSLLRGQEGAGNIGCIVFLVLFCAAAFAVYQAGPVYYSHMSFESDVRNEISRAGANFFDNETIKREILNLAKRYELPIKSENITIDRFASEVRVIVQYSVRVDFVVQARTLQFEVRAGSLVGRL